MEDKQKILLTEIIQEGVLRIVMNVPNSKNAFFEKRSPAWKDN
tara:strand:+ start:2319 stop:2447 length:129 start_codon:yes stop_codon:yes gene_type:complete